MNFDDDLHLLRLMTNDNLPGPTYETKYGRYMRQELALLLDRVLTAIESGAVETKIVTDYDQPAFPNTL